MSERETLEWQAPEYIHYPKTKNWYWWVGVISAAFLVLAILLQNFLFAIIVLLGAFTVLLYGARAPQTIPFAFTPKGVRIRQRFFPYDRLHSFWVHDDRHPHKVIVESERTFLPHLVISLPSEISNEEARAFLLQYLPEVHHEESLIDIIWEELGF